MTNLLHYEKCDNPRLRNLVSGDITYTVLYKILGCECDHIFTDGENIIVCHSNPPYPVWVWCKDTKNEDFLSAIAKCIKKYFPLEEYDVIMPYNALSGLQEKDDYFLQAGVKTELLSYRLDAINNIHRVCDGRMEKAKIEDLEFLTKCFKDMAMEMEGHDFSIEHCRDRVSEQITNEILFVWRDDSGEIVACANRKFLDGVGSVSGVYTLPRHRRCGYAINLVHGITKDILRLGHTPTLYTDGGYNASNECYKKIGYRQVGRLCTVCIKN